MTRHERYARRSATDWWELSPLDEEVAAMTGKRRRADGDMLHSPWTAARRVYCANKVKAEPRMAKRAAHSKAMSAALWGVAAVAAATGGAAPMEAVSPAGPVGPFVERAGQLPELGYWIRRSACTPELPLR
jgi:hypothetical protein